MLVETLMGDEKPKIRCAIVDDHPLVRQGVHMTLTDAADFEIVAEGACGNDAVAIAREHRPEVMLLDFSMPQGGIENITAVLAVHPAARIALFSIRNEPETVRAAIVAGALGFIAKGIDGAQLVAGVRRVAQGETFVSPELAQQLGMPAFGAKPGH